MTRLFLKMVTFRIYSSEKDLALKNALVHTAKLMNQNVFDDLHAFLTCVSVIY